MARRRIGFRCDRIPAEHPRATIHARRSRRLIVGVSLLSVIGLAGCASSQPVKTPAADQSVTPSAASPPASVTLSAACQGEVSGAPAAKLPSNVPGAAGLFIYDKVSQGATTDIFGSVRGVPSGIVSERNAILAQLERAGYQETDHDQEPGSEAEADLTGPVDLHLRVRALVTPANASCPGYLQILYSLGGH
jgi:hypothetical protein